jgi:hypothetical protein
MRLKKIGCAADGAPYVIKALVRQVNTNQVVLDFRFGNIHSPQAVEVATTFLDKTKCPGALGLSEKDKEKLQDILDQNQ